MDPGALLLQLFTPAARANPYPIYAQLREAAPVFKTPMGGWMVTRYEQVDRVLRSPAFRSPRGGAAFLRAERSTELSTRVGCARRP